MSATNTINQITAAELQYAPAVLAGVQAAEVSGASGSAKAQAVIDGIMTGAGALAQTQGIPPSVSGIAALVNLTVSILNALGVFRKKSQPVAAAPGA